MRQLIRVSPSEPRLVVTPDTHQGIRMRRMTPLTNRMEGLSIAFMQFIGTR